MFLRIVRVQAQAKVVQLLKKLAVHAGAALGLLEDESLQRLFRAAAGLLNPQRQKIREHAQAQAQFQAQSPMSASARDAGASSSVQQPSPDMQAAEVSYVEKNRK